MVGKTAARAAVEHEASACPETGIVAPEGEVAFRAAKKHLEGKARLRDWEDDVEFGGWQPFYELRRSSECVRLRDSPRT